MNVKKYTNNTWREITPYKYSTSVETYTDLPQIIYANGNSASIGLKGALSQSGVPSPTTPIQPQECGDRTGNLFDKDAATRKAYVAAGTGAIVANNSYFATDYISVNEGQTYYWNDISGRNNAGAFYDENKNYLSGLSTSALGTLYFTVPQGASYIRLTGDLPTMDNYMLNTGSTAPSTYIPYGYKIPISSASTTTPVYLGEVQSTRRIKKLVLDGTENWNEGTSNYYIFINVSGRGDGIPNSTALSTHTESGVVTNNNGTALFFKKSVFVYSSLADFKAYLAAQYAAGTPVCVWYVLATETTGIINEPIRKIGNYADTVSGITIPTITGKDSFDVDTTLKPSEVSLSYTGWHDASVKEWDGSQWE